MPGPLSEKKTCPFFMSENRNCNETSFKSIYLEYISGFSPIFNQSLKDKNKNKYYLKYYTKKDQKLLHTYLHI